MTTTAYVVDAGSTTYVIDDTSTTFVVEGADTYIVASGPQGPKGDPGAEADLTAITDRLDVLETALDGGPL